MGAEKPRRSLTLLLVALLLGSMLGYPAVRPALAASAALPGGTSIAVSIDSPADGTVVPPGPLTITGTASVGTGAAVENTALITVLDVSGSTVLNNAGTDCNGDGVNDLIFACEIAAARGLNDAAAAGSVAKVGVVGFSTTAVTADVTPSDDPSPLTGPTTDGGGQPGPDMNEVLASAFSVVSTNEHTGGFTRFSQRSVDNGETKFSEGILRAVDEVNAASDLPNRVVAFMSDGQDSEDFDDSGQPLLTTGFLQHAVPPGVRIFTFAVGTSASCGAGDNTLGLIASVTGASCTQVTNSNLGDLPGKLAEVVASHLTAVSVTVDGTPATVDVTPALPQTGPTSASYRSTVDLPAGTHRICATAAGTDAGGPGGVSECHTVIANTQPTADPGGPYTGLQGAAIPIAGKASDPDEGQQLSTTWTATAGPGVDPAGSCSFGDAAALATTVTCTAPGDWALALTVSDGVGQPVTVGTTLFVTNVPPEVSAGGPYTGTAGTPVTLTGTVADPDSPNLTLSWSVTPPPGSTPPPSEPPTSGPPTGEPPTSEPPTSGPPAPPTGACSFTDATVLSPLITCPTPGTYTLTLTAKDGFNDPVSATTTLTVVPARVPVSSLSLSGAVTPAVGFVGGTKITITYTLRNSGEVPLPAVRLATTLPAALPAAAGTCVPSCGLGDLQPGQQAVVTLTLTPTAAADGKVVAVATTTGRDTTAADNTASVRVLIRQPTLAVDPTTGPPGLVTQATGRSFPPGAIVHLAWSDGITQLPGNVLVGRDGTFETQALVFNHDAEGPRTLVATPVRGTTFGPVPANSFLVARRAFEPPFDQP